METNRLTAAGLAAAVIVALLLAPTAAQAATPPTDLARAHGHVEREVDIPDGLIVPRSVENAEGGTWDYGVGSRDVYSNYLHPSRNHGSSVKNGDGVTRRSDFVGKNAWARASLEKKYPGNKAYYRFTN